MGRFLLRLFSIFLSRFGPAFFYFFVSFFLRLNSCWLFVRCMSCLDSIFTCSGFSCHSATNVPHVYICIFCVVIIKLINFQKFSPLVPYGGVAQWQDRRSKIEEGKNSSLDAGSNPVQPGTTLMCSITLRRNLVGWCLDSTTFYSRWLLFVTSYLRLFAFLITNRAFGRCYCRSIRKVHVFSCYS